jgi:hypothetical protein
VHDPTKLRDYRRGRAVPTWQPKPPQMHRREAGDEGRREQYAEGIARAEFGRFYWNGTLDGELAAAMKRRKRNGSKNNKRARP